MTTETDKRMHRCCFTGHRPEKLNASEVEVKQWLAEQIDQAQTDGFVTFITGCAMGVDIWAGQIVLERRAANQNIHLIAATPWPGFARRWKEEWKNQYDDLIRRSDLVVNVCEYYHKGVFQQRNEWMVDRSNRVIAFYNGSAGGTRNTIEYAQRKGIEVCVFETVGVSDAVNYEALSGKRDKDTGLIATEDMKASNYDRR